MVSNIMNEVFQTSSPWMTFLIIINLILCLYPILGAMFWFFGALHDVSPRGGAAGQSGAEG